MTEARRSVDLAMWGSVLDLLFAVGLAIMGTALARDTGGADAVPRPVVLGVLYGAPGVIGLIGARYRQPWILVGAAFPLIPGAFLSWGGLTLPFAFVAVLMIFGAAGIPADRSPAFTPSVAAAAAIAIAVLIVAAAWGALFGLTHYACSPGGAFCDTAATTTTGVIVGAVCLSVATGLAAFGARRASRVAQ